MKRILIWTIVAFVLLACYVLYRSRAGGRLDVTPDARRAIDKAKSR